MIGARRALVLVSTGAFLAVGACDLALGLGDLKDRPSTGPAIDANVDHDGATEAGQRDAGPPPRATSCTSKTGAGLTACGPKGDEDCCATFAVPGGIFYRSSDPLYPAQISGFYLDRFEVTVGRFRAFLDATDGNFRPTPGSGKHIHLNAGEGLRLVNGGFELGWMEAWNNELPTTRAKWIEELRPGTEKYCTWDPADAGDTSASDVRPVNCVSWYEAYAFCIWDGGFLPSEAEWNYAAAGGDEQRVRPWSTPPGSNTIDCSYANHGRAFWPTNPCVDAGPLKVGALSAQGDGKWRQADLGGNVYEWTLDGNSEPYVNPCIDCLNVAEPATRTIRGGAFISSEEAVLSSRRTGRTAEWNVDYIGLRCARPL